MSDVRWEPVEDGWCDVTEDEDNGSSIGWDDPCVSIMMDGELSWRSLPPDIRLCRAVPAAPALDAVFVGQPLDAVPIRMRVQDTGIGKPIAVDLDDLVPATVPQPPGEA